jgi:hemerythrin-like metal-binding protein
MPAWTPSLDIGVAEIDAQHRTMFERVGRIEAAVKAREPYFRLEKLFAFLKTYALTHFASEEGLMLTEHVKNSDQRSGDFLRRRGRPSGRRY